MNNFLKKYIKLCITNLKKKKVIAYPTESVFGLGCDPNSKTAVMNLLKIKKRSINKGLILIASNYNQFLPYLKQDNISNYHIKKMLLYWIKKPITFVVPAAENIPVWLTGKFNSIAIRITHNLVAKNICQEFGKPIISTSANICGESPCRTVREVKKKFGKKIFILFGKTNNIYKTSEIRDILTWQLIRK